MQKTKEGIDSLKKIIGEYSFCLECIPGITIKIKLFKYLDYKQDEVFFETSHYIQTPTQAGPYLTSLNSMSTEELALDRAIETITSYYKSAIDEGYEPSEKWLVENTCFDE